MGYRRGSRAAAAPRACSIHQLHGIPADCEVSRRVCQCAEVCQTQTASAGDLTGGFSGIKGLKNTFKVKVKEMDGGGSRGKAIIW